VATPEVSIVTENLPGSQVGLTIEVPQSQVDGAYDRVLQRLSQRVKIEGFRPGKAPRALVEARLGASAIREEVIDALVPETVDRALKDREIEAIDRPQVEIQELERGRPARFTAKVSVWPEVTLPDLDSLRVDRPSTEVTDDVVDRRLLELRERLAEVEPVEREARPGDVVVGDLKVTVDGREVPSEARTASEIELREGVVIPELLAALPGRKTGEVAVADITMPEEHPDPEVSGRPARLEVTVQGVKQKTVPELSDEVAEQLSGGEAKTAGALREATREDLVQQARRLDELAFEQAAVKAVVEAAQVEIPDSLVDREVDRELEDLERRLGRRGLRLDRYIEYLGKTEEEYRAGLREDAEARVRTDVVLEQTGKKLEINPGEDEVSEYMRTEVEKDDELKGQADRLTASPQARDYFRHRLTRLKVLEALVARLGGDHSEAGQESGPEATAEAREEGKLEAKAE
jgi:trigger factor